MKKTTSGYFFLLLLTIFSFSPGQTSPGLPDTSAGEKSGAKASSLSSSKSNSRSVNLAKKEDKKARKEKETATLQPDKILIPPSLPSFRLNENIKPIKSDKIPHITQRVPVTAIRVGNNALKISFNWMASAKAALFKRDNRLFIAFNRPALFNTSYLSGQSSFLTEAQSLPLQTGSAIVITLKEDINISFKENPKNHNWVITLTQEQDNLSDSAPLDPSLLKTGTDQNTAMPLNPVHVQSGKIYLDTKEVTPPLFFEDPVTGEDLTVLITDDALKEGRTFQEVEALPTLLGLAFVSKSDEIAVLKKEDSHFILTTTHGHLALSSSRDLTSSRIKAPLPQLIDHKKWSLLPTDLKELFQLNEKLVREITKNPKTAPKKRLKRTFLFLAMDRGYEASGQLKLVIDKNPFLENEGRIALLKGIAHVLSHQPDRALQYLTKPSLEKEEEAVLWRGLVDLQQGKPYKGLKKILPHLKRLTLYPKRMRQTPYFLLAEAAVRTNYPGKIFLNSLDTDIMTRREKNNFDLLTAQMETSPQNRDFAKRLYKKVLSGKNVEAKVLAEIALLEKDPKKNRSNIDLLEHYRYRWRGDATELDLLSRLASLYAREKMPEKAMALYQSIRDHSPDGSRRDLEISRGQDLLYGTVLNNQDLPHFRIIAFYERFKDLAPSDERRFTLLQKVAETYENMDLIPQAAKYLESLLKQQGPTGDDRGKILLHLAKLYKQNHKEKMLEATLSRLDQIHFTDKNLARERLLQKALFEEEKKRPQKAIELLAGEESYEGLLLKTRLAWKVPDWSAASNALSKLLSHPRTTPEQREDFLISLSVALYKQNHSEDLGTLRKSFQSSFQSPSKKETFLLLTSPKPEIPETPTYKELLAQIAAIENFEQSLQKRKIIVQ